MVDFLKRDKKRDEMVSSLRVYSEESFVRSVAKQIGYKYIDLAVVHIETDALSILTESESRENEIVVFYVKNNDIYVAMRNPEKPEVLKILEKLSEKYNIKEKYLISKLSLKKAIDRFDDISKAKISESGVIEIRYVGDELSVNNYNLSEIKTLEKFKKVLKKEIRSKETHQTFRILNVILYSAYSLGASDIHIEPEEKATRIRFRIDGILMEIETISNEVYRRLLSRIKLTSGLKINVRKNAQDGRFSIRLKDIYIEIRASTLPDAYGESIVMRLLDPRAISVDLEQLGMLPYFYKIMDEAIRKPNGMILNTGPTGSGKSTTLFAFLRRVKTPDIKIITIENPIEYHVEGLVQTQVDPENGYTFLSGLRAALRQDPDVIMVGEIRDNETASVAVNSALTGHLVLSTLHTNSAAGTFARLIDLKISPKILSTAINVIIAQRLVRKLCVYCKKEIDLANRINLYNKEKVDYIYSTIEDKDRYIKDPEGEKKIYDSVGCGKCNGTGYKGRVAIFEAIIMDEVLEKILLSNPTEREIKKISKIQKILNLKQDGVIKVLTGVTSIRELSRVIDIDM